MSNLKVGQEDFPAAAEKMQRDAAALLSAGRYDGAAYLAGYAVECSLKTVLLLEAYARVANVRTEADLLLNLALVSQETKANTLKDLRAISHTFSDAIDAARGTRGLRKTKFFASVWSSPVTLSFQRRIWNRYAVVLQWVPSLRYGGEGAFSHKRAKRWVNASTQMVTDTVGAMRRQGLVTG